MACDTQTLEIHLRYIFFRRFAAMLRSPWLSLWPTLLFCYKGGAAINECRNQSCRLMLLQQRKALQTSAIWEDNQSFEEMLGDLLREHGKVYDQYMNDSKEATRAPEEEHHSNATNGKTCEDCDLTSSNANHSNNSTEQNATGTNASNSSNSSQGTNATNGTSNTTEQNATGANSSNGSNF
eukprot:s11_g77.t2